MLTRVPPGTSAGTLAKAESAPHWARELPELRAQYVARDTHVLVGSRWRLRRFHRRMVALRTGATPTLSLYAVDQDPTQHTAEATLVLPLDAVCKLTGPKQRRRNTFRSGSGSLRGVKLSKRATTPGELDFRLRLRFSNAVDAQRWCKSLQGALAHACWSRDVQPQTVQCDVDLKPTIRLLQRVKVDRQIERFVVKTLATRTNGDCRELRILRRLYTSAPVRELQLLRGYRVVATPRDLILIMPQFPGVTLLTLLRTRHREHQALLSDTQARRLLQQLASLLQAVHASGVVHCDLKLENVLVTPDVSRVALIDFGGAYDLLATSSSDEQTQHMTGTPGYVAPERILDAQTPPTPQSDVFSLGVLLFQVLAGQHPFVEATRDQRPLVLRDSLRLDWTHAQLLLRSRAVSDDLVQLVGRMLVSVPNARISLDQVLTSLRFND